MNQASPTRSIKVILFAYRRPVHFARTLATIEASSVARRVSLTIFVDGPKGNGDVEEVEEVRSLARRPLALKDVSVHVSVTNAGLATSIIHGVTQVLASNDRVIVLEDDLDLSTEALEYLERALDFYETEERVGSVTAFSYPTQIVPAGPREDCSVFFLRRPCSWAWGTWGDRWAQMEWDGRSYSEFRESHRIRRDFALSGRDLPFMLERQLRGEIDSWAIRWAFQFHLKGLLCAYPPVSFVNNSGSDGSGTHGGKDGERIRSTKLALMQEVRFSNRIGVDAERAKSLDRYASRRLLIRRLGRWVERTLRGVFV